MLVFICDQWFKLKEQPDNLLSFVSYLPENREGYFSLWASETEKNDRQAVKVLPFSGHQIGVYKGCTMVSYHPDGPPHSLLIHYETKEVQAL